MAMKLTITLDNKVDYDLLVESLGGYREKLLMASRANETPVEASERNEKIRRLSVLREKVSS